MVLALAATEVLVLVVGATVRQAFPDPGRGTLVEYLAGDALDCLVQGVVYGATVLVYLMRANPAVSLTPDGQSKGQGDLSQS
jgi:hypothetical protein